MINIEQKLGELAALQPNWDSYGGQKITPEAIRNCREFLESCSIVPGSDGGIQLEWHGLGYDLEIAIAPDGTVQGVWMGVTPLEAPEKEKP